MKITPLFYFALLFVSFLGCKENSKNDNPETVNSSVTEINTPNGSFEGIIYFDNFNEFTGQTTGRYLIKGEHIRIEHNNLDASIFMPEKDIMVGLMMEERAYMEIDMKKAYKDKASQKNGVKLEKTGETKKIAGYTCDVWHITGDDGTTSAVCMAKGLGNFISPANPLSVIDNDEWKNEIGDDGYMQLEVVTNVFGTEKIAMKVTKIENKKLADSLFVIPKGFTKVSSVIDKYNKKL